ncbi:hypothetical protein OQA88_13700 [Cercophora sp. LCS_1]
MGKQTSPRFFKPGRLLSTPPQPRGDASPDTDRIGSPPSLPSNSSPIPSFDPRKKRAATASPFNSELLHNSDSASLPSSPFRLSEPLTLEEAVRAVKLKDANAEDDTSSDQTFDYEGPYTPTFSSLLNWDVSINSKLFDPDRPRNLNDLEAELYAWAWDNRFGYNKRRSRDRGSSKNYDLVCNRTNPKMKASQGYGSRRKSRKVVCGCSFRVTVTRYTKHTIPGLPDEGWTARLVDPTHTGHAKSETRQAHAMNRIRSLTSNQIEWFDSKFANPTIKCGAILDMAQMEWPDKGLIIEDVYMLRYQYRRKVHDGYPDFNASCRLITERKYIKSAKQFFDSKGDMSALCWMTKTQYGVWKRAPHCFLMDATYCVNNKEWPLFIAVVVTSERVVIPVFQALVRSETDEVYD